MAWVDLSGAFGYGTKLTSTQMQNLRDNIAAQAAGDSGAPETERAALEADIIDATKIEDSAVEQAHLKTATSEVSITGTSGTLTPSGVGSYGLYPQCKGVSLHASAILGIQIFSAAESAMASSYTTYVYLSQTYTGGTLYAQFRYIQASGEVYWIFLLRNKATKAILATSFAPDHVCFGNGGKPQLAPHPFASAYEKSGLLYHPIQDENGVVIDEEEVEILVVNPTKAQVLEMESLCTVEDELEDDLCMGEVFEKHYDIDDTVQPPYPVVPVTVGLSKLDLSLSPVKKIIPQPPMVRTAGVEKKQIAVLGP